MLKQGEVRQYLNDNRIQWQFNVEKAPWWGEIFERMVKCGRCGVGEGREATSLEPGASLSARMVVPGVQFSMFPLVVAMVCCRGPCNSCIHLRQDHRNPGEIILTHHLRRLLSIRRPWRRNPSLSRQGQGGRQLVMPETSWQHVRYSRAITDLDLDWSKLTMSFGP